MQGRRRESFMKVPAVSVSGADLVPVSRNAHPAPPALSWTRAFGCLMVTR
jgi:hypothetical protein